MGLLPESAIDLSRVRFERLAHDTEQDRWYALAHLDLTEEAERLEAEVGGIERSLRGSLEDLTSTRVEYDDRVRAALSILYEVERRDLLRRRYVAVHDEVLEIPADLSDDLLRENADDLLSKHGVRVLVEGTSFDELDSKLETSVASAIGEVHLKQSDSGFGLIRIHLSESWTYNRGYNYLELDGEIVMSIEGGDARSYTVPLRIVGIGVDAEEASFRATRDAGQEIGRIVRAALREMSTSGG